MELERNNYHCESGKLIQKISLCLVNKIYWYVKSLTGYDR